MTELELHGGGELLPARDGDLWVRLAALDEAAAQHVTRKANTARSYSSDWKAWEQYTTTIGIPLEAATIGSFVGFVLWHQRAGLALSTASRRLYGVVVSLRDRGVTVPQDALDGARLALDQFAREVAELGEQRGRGKAAPVTVAALRKMSAALPDTLKGVRDRAILLVGFGIAGRRAEVANLLTRDVAVHPEGLVVQIRYAKTTPRSPAVARGTHPLTCPVRAWQAWAQAVELAPDGPAFRRVNRHGQVLGGMSAQAVGNVWSEASVRAGLPRLTAHGARSGLATEARRAGHDAKTIAQQGGWSPNSRVLYEYMRIVDQWADNATAGLGL
ncbi:tyrosine-type recombinase/integrase [Streptosporangium sp. NPDC049248]|uniref:tyrosine-type recombinase/integrase n=1 Tax=Streptosporangium sp. NPDC049248 TaxID=3155651 RepID=UPI00344513A2